MATALRTDHRLRFKVLGSLFGVLFAAVSLSDAVTRAPFPSFRAIEVVRLIAGLLFLGTLMRTLLLIFAKRRS